MKLEIALLAGDETKKFLHSLTKQIDRLEALSKISPEAEDDTEAFANDENDNDFEAKQPSKSKAAKASFDDGDEDEAESEDAKDEGDDEEQAEVEEEETEDEEPPLAAKKKAKKLTVDDCNDAAKELARSIGGKPGREKVLSLMKKYFKTESVSELKSEQYAKFIEVMKKGKK